MNDVSSKVIERCKGPVERMKSVPRKMTFGYAGQFLWKVSMIGLQLLRKDTGSPSVFQIMEQPGAIERMAEVDLPRSTTTRS